MTDHKKSEPREFWIYTYKITGGIVDCRSSPTPVRFNPATDTEHHVIEYSAYEELRKELEAIGFAYKTISSCVDTLYERVERLIKERDGAAEQLREAIELIKYFAYPADHESIVVAPFKAEEFLKRISV